MRALILALFPILTGHSPAQILGASESFTSEENATSWARVDFANLDSASDALWTIPGSQNPEIYTTFNQDFETSLFADELSSGAAFVGDYDAVGIDVVRSDVYVEDLSTFAELEFYLLAGDTFYYSDLFDLTEPGWALVETSLTRDQWYFFDDDERVFVPVELTPMILSDVKEVGITFYPSGPGADGSIVALDNFTLLPDLVVPDLAITLNANRARISFTGIEGMQYTLQANPTLRGNRWRTVGDPFESDGPFQTNVPLVQKRFFRLMAQPFFVEIL